MGLGAQAGFAGSRWGMRRLTASIGPSGARNGLVSLSSVVSRYRGNANISSYQRFDFRAKWLKNNTLVGTRTLGLGLFTTEVIGLTCGGSFAAADNDACLITCCHSNLVAFRVKDERPLSTKRVVKFCGFHVC